MQTQRPWLLVPLVISLTLNALTLSRIGSLTDWVNRLTFGDGEEALVEANGFCCQPVGY